MKILLLLLSILCGTLSVACAQAGKVEVTKDPKIDTLIARRLAFSKKSKTSGKVEGFRIQIYSGSERTDAYQEQSRFKTLYPEVFAYVSYILPNYKVRVGDFRTRMEAEKFMNKIKQNFATVFIFPDQVSPR